MNTILIGGKARPFHYTVGVLKKIIQASGNENPEKVPFSKLGISGDALSLDSLTMIIHASLNAGAKRTGGETLKIEQVTEWIDDMSLDELMAAFNSMTGTEEIEDTPETEEPGN